MICRAGGIQKYFYQISARAPLKYIKQLFYAEYTEEEQKYLLLNELSTLD